MLDGATAKLNAPSGTLVPSPLPKTAESAGDHPGVAAPLAAAAVAVLTAAHAECDIPPAYDLIVEGASAPRAPATRRRPVPFASLAMAPRARPPSTRPGTADARARVMIDRDGTLVRWDAERAPGGGAIRIDARALPSRRCRGARRCGVRIDGSESPRDRAIARKAMRGRDPHVPTLLSADRRSGALNRSP